MALIQIKDRSGVECPVYKWDGYYFSPLINGHLENISLHSYLNDDDYSGCEILLCSYPRSGSHWLYENLHMLLTKTFSRTSLLFQSYNTELKILREGKQPRIATTRLNPHLVPDGLNHAKRIYLYRNPKDVAYSRYKLQVQFYKYKGTFEDYAELFLEGKVHYGSWFDHTLEWEAENGQRNTLVISYEKMVKDPLQVLRRIANYLEIEADEGFLRSVVEACDIDKMRPRNPTPDTEVIRKGVPGGWRNHFTVALSEKFDRVFTERMKTSKMEFIF